MSRYAHLPEALIKALPQLSGKAAKVAIALGVHMSPDGTCFPGREVLSAETGIRRLYSVTEALEELVAAGVLVIQRRANTSSLYTWTTAADGTKSVPSGKYEKCTFHDSGKYTNRTDGRYEKCTSNIPTEHTQNISSASSSEKTPRLASQPKASRAEAKPNVWTWWVAAHREVAWPDPLPEGPDLKAAKALGAHVASGRLTESDLRMLLALYLADEEGFLQKSGHALRHLPGRINRYRQSLQAQDVPYDQELQDLENRIAAEEAAHHEQHDSGAAPTLGDIVLGARQRRRERGDAG